MGIFRQLNENFEFDFLKLHPLLVELLNNGIANLNERYLNLTFSQSEMNREMLLSEIDWYNGRLSKLYGKSAMIFFFNFNFWFEFAAENKRKSL